MSNKVRVNVPKEVGESVTLSFGGQTHTYKVTDGHVSVERANVERFLSAVPGSSEVASSDAGTSGDEK